ncbi:MAG TPA: hypothetical protein VGK73_21285, partial [Polyangiaceae bacterium]
EDFVVEVTGCRKELDDSLRCSASLDDICDIPRSCAREIKAQLDCYDQWCEGRSDDICEN